MGSCSRCFFSAARFALLIVCVLGAEPARSTVLTTPELVATSPDNLKSISLPDDFCTNYSIDRGFKLFVEETIRTALTPFGVRFEFEKLLSSPSFQNMLAVCHPDLTDRFNFMAQMVGWDMASKGLGWLPALAEFRLLQFVAQQAERAVPALALVSGRRAQIILGTLVALGYGSYLWYKAKHPDEAEMRARRQRGHEYVQQMIESNRLLQESLHQQMIMITKVRKTGLLRAQLEAQDHEAFENSIKQYRALKKSYLKYRTSVEH